MRNTSLVLVLTVFGLSSFAGAEETFDQGVQKCFALATSEEIRCGPKVSCPEKAILAKVKPCLDKFIARPVECIQQGDVVTCIRVSQHL